MPSPLTLPAGYTISRSRDGYALHLAEYGEIGEGDFGCWASACFAAHDHADAVADEANPDDIEIAQVAYDRALDGYHWLATQHAEGTAYDAKARGKRRAARALLAAIDGLAAQIPAASQKAA